LPTKGELWVANIPLREENLQQVRRRAGLVFQDPSDQLFHLTVGEDVAFGPRNLGLPKDEVCQRVEQALRSIGLEGFEEKRNEELSFGERRRAALATTLAMEPEILILDEPFANLDPHNAGRLEEIIRSLPCTVLLASQEIIPALSCCEEGIILHEGNIHAQGNLRDLVSDHERMRACGLDLSRYHPIWQNLLSSASDSQD
jgi:cobalt/nickel transport system ATP-binding protein